MKKHLLSLCLLTCLLGINYGQNNVIGNGGFEINSFPNGNVEVYVDPIDSNPNDYIPCWTFGCPYTSANPPAAYNTPTVVPNNNTYTPYAGDFCALMERTYGATGSNMRDQVLKFRNDCSPTLQHFEEGDYQLCMYVRGIASCKNDSIDGEGFSMNVRLRKDKSCVVEKYIGARAVPISDRWTKLTYCFSIEEGELFNEVEFFQTHVTGIGEHHIETLVDEVSMCLIDDLDISHLNGQVCSSDAIIEIPKGVGNYTIEVGLAFQGTVCTITGNGPGTVNIFDQCKLQCDDQICYQVKVNYERCGRSKIATALPHFVCGPKAKAYASPAIICPGESTWLIAQNCQPSLYTYEWYNSLTPNTPIGSGCWQFVTPTTNGGTYSLKVTDPTTGCSTTVGVLIGWKICDIGKKSTHRNANPNAGDILFNIHPNPANSQLFISREGEDNSTGMIRLISAQGKVIQQRAFTEHDFEMNFNTTDVMPGIYFTQIIVDGEVIKNKKIVIAH